MTKFILPLVRLGAAALLALAAPAFAQDLPANKPIRVIIPTAPGGQPDIISRMVSDPWSRLLGQPVVVENIAGSGGVAAIQTVQAAPPDGTMIFVGDAAHWAISPALRPKQATDFLKIFTPIRQTHQTSIVLVVNNNLPVTNVKELIAYMKANPGKLNYGSAGVGSVHHLTSEAFKHYFGVDAVHVPYKTSAQALTPLQAGELGMLFSGLATVTSFVKAGRVRLIAMSNRARTPLMPELVPIAESTNTDFDYGSAAAMFVRVDTPAPIVQKLWAALDKAFQMPDIQQKLTQQNIEFIKTSTPASTLEMVKADIPRWANAAKWAGAQE